jgi:hypothetical protein
VGVGVALGVKVGLGVEISLGVGGPLGVEGTLVSWTSLGSCSKSFLEVTFTPHVGCRLTRDLVCWDRVVHVQSVVEVQIRRIRKKDV